MKDSLTYMRLTEGFRLIRGFGLAKLAFFENERGTHSSVLDMPGIIEMENSSRKRAFYVIQSMLNASL